MPEISDLLHEAARGAQVGLDLDRVSRRARALRRREQAAMSTGAALAALVVAVPLLLHGGGSQRDEVRLVPAPTPSGPPTAAPTGDASGGPSVDASSSPGPSAQPNSTAGTPSEPPGDAGAQPGVPAAPHSSPSPSGSSGDYPPGASCHVSNAGLAPGESASCSYTATVGGGWVVAVVFSGPAGDRGEIDVTVIRDGRTISSSQWCSNDGIQAGDLVTATVRAGTGGGREAMSLQVGAGQRC